MRQGRRGESHLIRTTSINGTIDERYPESKQVSLFCPGGIPDVEEGRPASMLFSVVTDDFERDVPPVPSTISATLDIRTNGHFLRDIVATGVDPHPRRIVSGPVKRGVDRGVVFFGSVGMGMMALALAGWHAARGHAFQQRAAVAAGVVVREGGDQLLSSPEIAFHARGRRYIFTEKTLGRFDPEARVEVLYLLDDPTMARLGEGYLHRRAYLFAVAGLILLAVGYAF